MTAKFRLEGSRELEKVLKGLPRASRNKVVAGTLRKAARPIIAQARDKVPKGRTGELKRSMGTQIVREAGKIVARVGPRRGGRFKGGFYGHLVEFGTRHSRARPFLRPAFDEKAPESLRVIGAEMGQRIEKEARRLARK